MDTDYHLNVNLSLSQRTVRELNGLLWDFVWTFAVIPLILMSMACLLPFAPASWTPQGYEFVPLVTLLRAVALYALGLLLILILLIAVPESEWNPPPNPHASPSSRLERMCFTVLMDLQLGMMGGVVLGVLSNGSPFLFGAFLTIFAIGVVAFAVSFYQRARDVVEIEVPRTHARAVRAMLKVLAENGPAPEP